MRIDLNAGLPLEQPTSSSKARDPRPPSKPDVSAALVGSDLAYRQTNVVSLAAAAISAPEIRLDKVEALRASVASGSYHVTAERVAGSILEQMRTR